MEPKFDIEIYSDGAVIEDMREVAKKKIMLPVLQPIHH